jgi:DNA-binding Lrp family transcriptional regulator
MDDRDRQLLNLIQTRFPLVSRPYRELGQLLGESELEIIERVRRLRSERIIRQISAIFDTKALGYKSSLVAMRVPSERLGEAARIINEHPGVSHNYERNHEYNLWFTIAVPPSSDLEATVQRLHELAGAETTRVMYTLKLFKIGVELDMTGERPPDARARPQYGEADRERAGSSRLTERDIAVLRELQEDLPAEPEPFAPMAARLGFSEEELFGHARNLLERGFLRRYAAILYHRKAGFKSNAMGVWNVPSERIGEVGLQMASFAAVSHCYQRPTYPDWPYTIFTMVHGNSDEQCEEILAAISQATGITDYRSLYSTREYKKTRVRYFTPEMAEWEGRYLGEPVGAAASSESA